MTRLVFLRGTDIQQRSAFLHYLLQVGMWANAKNFFEFLNHIQLLIRA